MEIIKDTYNKPVVCPNCGSTFLYNEKFEKRLLTKKEKKGIAKLFG